MPAVGIGLPVLLVRGNLLVDVVEAEVVLAADEVTVLVHTAALWRWALSVWLAIDTADVTHGTGLLVLIEIDTLVLKHVLASVSTLLGVTTASDAIVLGHQPRVKLLGLIRKGWIFANFVLELQSLRADSKQHRGCE